MRTFWYSRRTFIAALAVVCLTVLGLAKGMDVSASLAMIAMAVAGANAFEGSKTSTKVDTPQGGA